MSGIYAADGSENVTVVGTIPGTGPTALGKAEDAAALNGDTGVSILAVRQDTLGTPLAGTTGDYIPLITDANGFLVTGPDGLAVSGSVTSAAVLFTQDMLGYESISVQVTSAGTTCTLVYEFSEDQTTWTAAELTVPGAIAAGSTVASSSTAVGLFQFARLSRYFRVRCSVYGSGTVTVSGSLSKAPINRMVSARVLNSGFTSTGVVAHDTAISGNPVRIGARGLSASYATVATGDTTDLITTLDGRLIINPLAIPENTWNYAAATGGISNTTTAVTVQAAHATLRNYITGIDISRDTLGAATEFVIRDGAGGTVLWRMKLGTTVITEGFSKTFSPPLRGTAATLTEIATLTASVTGGVFANLQGFVAP